MSGPGTERVSERVANVEDGNSEQSGAKAIYFFVRLEGLDDCEMDLADNDVCSGFCRMEPNLTSSSWECVVSLLWEQEQ